MSETYSITTQVFNDLRTNCYKRIFTIDRQPLGPLKNLVKQIQNPKLSEFQTFNSCGERKSCVLAIYNPDNLFNLLTINEQPRLLTFLNQNNYTVDTNITKIMMKNRVQSQDRLMFIITY
tara:strand:+ start:72 stop:431 length:360 start_codon:yes stop_codon:yes gene_type:complete